VVAGEEHTCALLRRGSVTCWGGNTLGQLGDGTRPTASAGPVTVKSISGAVGIAAGRFHTCAVLRDGAVRCWGANDTGQLGHASAELSDIPVAVGGIASARAVAAGQAHTCALLNDRTVRCWGWNEAGQLGQGLPGGSFAVPAVVEGISEAVTLGAGGLQSCAVLVDGTQRCWGTDGPPRTEHRFAMRTPVPLETPGIAGALAVAPGLAHNCILLRVGTVRCRGNNSEGQLGDGTFESSRLPVPVTGVAAARAIVSGDAHTCVLVADGHVHCWGSNASAQLGRPIVEASPRPLVVGGVAGAVALASGEAHACVVLADRTARCWGQNEDGQLGRGWTGQSSFRAEAVIGLSRVTALALGAGFSCALLDDRTIRCWGKNSHGELGDGTTRGSALPVGVREVSGAIAIGAGTTQGCAALASGTLVCWGQAGRPASAAPSGTRGLLPVPELETATTVALGQDFGCATRRDLTLVCWGANDVGQLSTPEVPAVTRPVMVTGVAYSLAVTAGSQHACALRRDGKVKCWGRSHVGQLGRAGIGDFKPRPLVVEGIADVVGLSAGAAHTCVLSADGAIRCWGSNETGQLARDLSLKFSHSVVQVELSR
jgi:alpha-tubulin suppressor-like RCC1 family protein